MHTNFGRNPTFDQMGANNDIMDGGSFLRFCKDFKILGEKRRTDYRTLTKMEILGVFKKHATF